MGGIVFTLGAAFGVSAFGENVQPNWEGWNISSCFGHVSLIDILPSLTGVWLLLVFLMALFLLSGGEMLEASLSRKDMSKELKLRLAGAAVGRGESV